MKVTFTPDITAWKHNCECSRCHSKMDIIGDDVLYKEERRYTSDDSWGGGSYMEAVYYVVCPMCQAEIHVNSISTKMPYLLTQKIQERNKKGKK